MQSSLTAGWKKGAGGRLFFMSDTHPSLAFDEHFWLHKIIPLPCVFFPLKEQA
ncbi:hypothetical protein KK083_06185 [Fulvivirgaceae bacterium PWU4]|uniref:Uncharacterized protein n=1 Tax=Chryseosolibacter histidini TaxID=2782349 RepID=A0AAP2DJ15_9BACT|nr:hypothetical protein [Chryseosolibacter histidini]MBT1696454.1 hypothetical protein [Chryseosolibacter histidini]